MTQPGFIKSIIDGFKMLSYSLLGTGRPTIIAGITGSRVKSDKYNRINASRSQRAMLHERGAQPQDVGIRRFLRNEARANKRKNSFKNNIDANGNVVTN